MGSPRHVPPKMHTRPWTHINRPRNDLLVTGQNEKKFHNGSDFWNVVRATQSLERRTKEYFMRERHFVDCYLFVVCHLYFFFSIGHNWHTMMISRIQTRHSVCSAGKWGWSIATCIFNLQKLYYNPHLLWHHTSLFLCIVHRDIFRGSESSEGLSVGYTP